MPLSPAKTLLAPFLTGGALIFLSVTTGVWSYTNQQKAESDLQNGYTANTNTLTPVPTSNITNTPRITNKITNTVSPSGGSPNPSITSTISVTVSSIITTAPTFGGTITSVPKTSVPGQTSTHTTAATATPTTTLLATTAPTTPLPTTVLPTTVVTTTNVSAVSYSADGIYNTPAGPQTIGVTLFIQNRIIQSVTITNKATDTESRNYVTRFSSGISAKVVGLSIDNSFNFTSVNGASLTVTGFKNAVAIIRPQVP